MPSRLLVTLTPEEMRALSQVSKEQMRDPREQIRYVLHQHLAEHGMLPSVDPVSAGRAKRKAGEVLSTK